MLQLCSRCWRTGKAGQPEFGRTSTAALCVELAPWAARIIAASPCKRQRRWKMGRCAPPAALLSFLRASAALGPGGTRWMCKSCASNTAFARAYNVAFHHKRVRQLFRCHPSALALLGFLIVCLDIEHLAALVSTALSPLGSWFAGAWRQQ
jgi:hypothetical protein